MGMEKGLWWCWCSVLWLSLLLIEDGVESSDQHQNKTCAPSRCGIITNIAPPFRLPHDPAHCGNRSYELACKNNVPLLHVFNGTYRVVAINYNNFTIRLVDEGIQETNCSSLPLYPLSRSNFSSFVAPDWYNEDTSNLYSIITLESYERYPLLFEQVGYLKCSDPVSDDAAYVGAAPCVNWGPRGHAYAVAGDMQAHQFQPQCLLKSVALLAPQWKSMVPGGRIKSYDEIHKLLSYGFELSWLPRACADRNCSNNTHCVFSPKTQSLQCVPDSKSGDPGWLSQLGSVALDYLIGIVEGLFKIAGQVDSDFYRRTSHFSRSNIARPLGIISGRFVLPFITARFLVGIMLLSILLIHTCRRRHLSMYEDIEDFIRLHSLLPLRYSYKDLKAITEGFKHKLGKGGFGTVYKGKLKSGIEVAVKILSNTKPDNAQQFINEVATIGRIHHFNVVHLVGFCVEGTKRALVYEFMPNGSLDNFIFPRKERASLSYRRIYEISLGVARGIAYLHHGCDMQILHFDIKPHNILLGDDFTPKISDFGLAKLYSIDNSIVTLTAARGTIGYMAPELFYKNIGGVSYKADVYSFGMLLMEMASRRSNLNRHVEHSSQLCFPSWIYDQFDEEKIIEMEDFTEEEKSLVKKMFIVALWCTQFKPTDRPSMSKVIEILKIEDMESIQMPPKPSLYDDDNDEVLKDDGSYSSQATSSFSIYSHGSQGEGSSDDDGK